ncbi:MAG: nuclear transport factor 2 family protein [Rhodospirillales bacterium]|nr:nuclear transport factor 2 family protein [Rhodospirillales bacterium]
MDFATLMQGLADAASAGDGDKVADFFTDDGIYHDVYYGAFQGREKIKEMIHNYFHAHAKNFIWDFHGAVSDGKVGYARYVFSYESTIAGCEGNRAMFEGVSHVELDGDKLTNYHEVANIGLGLVSLGFPAERTYKILQKHSAQLQARDESKHHFE